MSKLIKDHIKAVIFDFDDTLVGTIEAKWAAHKYVAAKHYGKQLTDDDIRPHWGVPLRTLVGILYGDEDLDRALAHEQSTHHLFPKKTFEGSVEVITKLYDAGLKLGIVTATILANLESDLKYAGIPVSLFSYLQTQDDTNCHKPDPRVFDPAKRWLESLKIKPGGVVYIGDGLHDMHAALGAGFEFIGVTTGLVTQKDFQEHHASSIDKLSDLLADT